MTLIEQAATKAGRSKAAKARKSLTHIELFFYEHGGYGYDPKVETAEQGRIRCAKQLAFAESYRLEHCWEVEWEEDWDIGSHKAYYGKGSAYEDREPNTCESALLRNEDGKVIGSLGCIDDATAEYRRVVEAELALEAIGDVESRMEAQREAIHGSN